MVTGYISGFSPGLLLLSIEFNAGISKISQLITWPLLLAGLGVDAPHTISTKPHC